MTRVEFTRQFLSRWESATNEVETFDLIFDMIKAMGQEKAKAPVVASGDSRAVLDAYYRAYERRYRFKLQVTPIMIRHCKNLVNKVGLDVAIAVVEEYLLSNDQFHANRRHEISLAVSSASELALRAEARRNGVRGPTQAEAKTRGVLHDNLEAMNDYLGVKPNEPTDLP